MEYREYDFNETVGLFLAEARRQHNKSVQDIAAAMNVTPEHIQKIESGQVEITMYQAKVFADIVGFSLGVLFNSGFYDVPPTVLDVRYMITVMQRVDDALRKMQSV